MMQESSATFNTLSREASRISQLSVMAKELQKKFCSLTLLVRRSLEDSHLEELKLLLCTLLAGISDDTIPSLVPVQNEIQRITNIQSLFYYLLQRKYMSYFNYELLCEFATAVITDQTVHTEIKKYETFYHKFIEEPTFADLMEVFRTNPDLNPNIIVGLPTIVVTLACESRELRYKQWQVDGWRKYVKSKLVYVKGIFTNSIILIYAIFPADLWQVVNDLHNPKAQEYFQEIGATVEIPEATQEVIMLFFEDRTSKMVINPSPIAVHICEVEKNITLTRTSLDEVITKANVNINHDELFQMLSVLRGNLIEAEKNIERIKGASEKTQDQIQMLEDKLTQQTEVEKQHLDKISALSEQLEKYKIQHSDFSKKSDAKMEEFFVTTVKQGTEICNLQTQAQYLQTQQDVIAICQEQQTEHLASLDESVNINCTISQHDKVIEAMVDLQAKVSNNEKKLREMEDNTDSIISKYQMQERRRISCPPGYSFEEARQYDPIKTIDRERMESGVSITSVTSEYDMIPPGNESGVASMATSRESSSSQPQITLTMDSDDTINTCFAGNDFLHLLNVDQHQMDYTTSRNTPPSSPKPSHK